MQVEVHLANWALGKVRHGTTTARASSATHDTLAAPPLRAWAAAARGAGLPDIFLTWQVITLRFWGERNPLSLVYMGGAKPVTCDREKLRRDPIGCNPVLGDPQARAATPMHTPSYPSSYLVLAMRRY